MESRRGLIERPWPVEEDRLRVTGCAPCTPSEEKEAAVADCAYVSGLEAARETGIELAVWSGRIVDVDKPLRREPGIRSDGGNFDASRSMKDKLGRGTSFASGDE